MSRRTPPEPGTARWSALVTASKVAAIVGASPWDSPWSMWHRMSGDLAPDPDNAARLRGRLLEPAVLAWWAHQHPDAADVTILWGKNTWDVCVKVTRMHPPTHTPVRIPQD